MGLTILCADDDDDTFTILSMILENKGHNLTRARDGLEAVELFEQDPPQSLIVFSTTLILKLLVTYL